MYRVSLLVETHGIKHIIPIRSVSTFIGKLRARETSLRVGIENLIMLEKVHYSGNGCAFNVINQFLVSCTV